MEARTLAVPTALILLVLIAPHAPADTIQASLETPTTLLHQGPTQTTTQGGIQATLDPQTHLTLTAQHLNLTTQREEGQRAGDATLLQLQETTNTDTTTHTFQNATLTLTIPPNKPTPLIAHPTQPTATLTAKSTNHSHLQALPQDTTLYTAGYSPTSQTAGDHDPPSHEEATTRPLAAHHGHDTATLHGTFPIALHNATLHITHDEGEHTDWTGYEEDDANAPITPYELRVATLQARNATLTLHAPNNITALAPTIQTRLQGTLHAPQAHGTLTTPQGTIQLQNEPLQAQGQGTLQTTTTPHQTTGNPLLEATLQGDYEILNAPTPTATATTQRSLPIGLLTLLTTATLTLAFGITLYRNPAPLQRLPTPITTRIRDRWIDQAIAHEENGRWDKATKAYHRLTQINPQRPFLWQRKTITHFERGEPRQALETIHEAQRTLNQPDTRLLEYEVLAYRDLDEHHEARNALLELARDHPDEAERLIYDLGLHDLARDPEIERLIGPNPGGGGLDGYT